MSEGLSIQIARLETKVDQLIVLFPTMAISITDHEKRLSKVENVGHPPHDVRITLLEQAHWKLVGISSVMGALLTYVSTFLISVWKGH